MKEMKRNVLSQFSPATLADQANTGFVELAHLLMRVVTFKRFSSIAKGRKQEESAEQVTHKNNSYSDSNDDSLENHKTNEGLINYVLGRLDRVLRNQPEVLRSNRESSTTRESQPNINLCYRLQLKELFHKDARRRLAAARWFYQRNCKEAIPALEGVLLIEENEKVRGQITTFLNEFAVKELEYEGEYRC